MKTRILFCIFYIFLILILMSCEKKVKYMEPETAKNIAIDNANGELVFADALDVTQEVCNLAYDSIMAKETSNINEYSCAKISITPFDLDSFPKTLVVDFGKEGCVNSQGKLRKGRIKITLKNGFLIDDKSEVEISLEGYYYNNLRTFGKMTIVNNGKNDKNIKTYTIKVEEAKFNLPNKKQSVWSTNKTIFWLNGEETSTSRDDEYLTIGSNNGTTANKEKYEIVITDTLHFKHSCDYYLIKGKQEIKAEGETIIVDYGNGECDDKVTVIYKKIYYDVFLKEFINP